MKRIALLLMTSLAVLAFAAFPTHRAAADDETGDTEIKVHAPLAATDCGATPPTITVLGLTIDVTAATFDSGNGGGDNQGGDQGGADQQGGDQGGDNQQSSGSCATLVVGDNVEVHFASDSTPLKATQVDDQGSDDQELSIEGPLQAVDTTGSTVKVLGLTINVGSATLGGADDNSDDGNSQPIDLTQLTVGQFVAVQLDASQLPALVATQLEVKNFANQVDVEVDDQNGNQVDDGAVDDVQVDVQETVVVQAPPALGVAVKHVRKTVRLHTTSNGSFSLSGLPTGAAKISVTRTANGVTSVGRRSVRVKPNTRRQVRVRLHHSH